MAKGEFRVIGEPEIIIGFGFAGVEGRPSFMRDDTLAAFRQACSDGVKVLLVTEDVAGQIRPELVEWQLAGLCPLVVELPCLAGPVEGHKSLVELIRTAIGVRV